MQIPTKPFELALILFRSLFEFISPTNQTQYRFIHFYKKIQLLFHQVRVETAYDVHNPPELTKNKKNLRKKRYLKSEKLKIKTNKKGKKSATTTFHGKHLVKLTLNFFVATGNDMSH